jgi:putative transposase
MTAPCNGVVRVGDEIRLRAQVFTVATIAGGSVKLIDAVDERIILPLYELLADPSLEVLAGSRPALSSAELVGDVPEEVAEQARWWERHLVEVLTGRRPDMPAGTPARPGFDPASQSLRQREIAKVEELHAAGYEAH